MFIGTFSVLLVLIWLLLRSKQKLNEQEKQFKIKEKQLDNIFDDIDLDIDFDDIDLDDELLKKLDNLK